MRCFVPSRFLSCCATNHAEETPVLASLGEYTLWAKCAFDLLVTCAVRELVVALCIADVGGVVGGSSRVYYVLLPEAWNITSLREAGVIAASKMVPCNVATKAG
jgi:hypothetical protein